MPKIREFRTTASTLLTRKLLHAKRQDGRPAVNFMYLRRFTISFSHDDDERNIRYLFQNAKFLEELVITVFAPGRNLVGLLSPSAHTLRLLFLSVPFYDDSVSLRLSGLCEELEAMAGQNKLEALACVFNVTGDETEDFIGSICQEVEKVLVKPGWSALRLVSFTVRCMNRRKLSEMLQSLPDKYLSHLPKIESVAFMYSVE